MKFDVTYEDGTTATLKVKPRHLVRFEEEVGEVGASEKIADGFKLPWIASDTGLSFDEWLATVDDIVNPDVAVPVAGQVGDEVPAEPVPTSSPSPV
jgi:hypothetical protein